ncbi:MAG: flagellar M-ring protein FliF C-terminal domain-containing protein, partial [Eubacteriales bacterium]
LVNQLIRQIQDSGGNITDITIAAVINAKELSTEDMAKYTNLIAHSAGVSPDKVALTNAEFYTPALPEPVITPEKKSFFDLINLSKQEVIIIAASLVFFILTLIFVICLISRKKRKKRFEEFEKIKRIEEESALSERANKKDLPGEIVLNETREQALKRQIKEFTSGNPETVAQLLRVWIKEEERK